MTTDRVSRLDRVSTAYENAVSVTASRVSPPSIGETQTRTHSTGNTGINRTSPPRPRLALLHPQNGAA